MHLFKIKHYASNIVLFVFVSLILSNRERSGRVLDLRPRGSGFEPHRHHCVLSLSKIINPSLVLVQPRKTRPFITERLLMRRKESNQTNKILNKKTTCTLTPYTSFFRYSSQVD